MSDERERLALKVKARSTADIFEWREAQLVVHAVDRRLRGLEERMARIEARLALMGARLDAMEGR